MEKIMEKLLKKSFTRKNLHNWTEILAAGTEKTAKLLPCVKEQS
jgi:hypothetical protein